MEHESADDDSPSESVLPRPYGHRQPARRALDDAPVHAADGGPHGRAHALRELESLLQEVPPVLGVGHLRPTDMPPGLAADLSGSLPRVEP